MRIAWLGVMLLWTLSWGAWAQPRVLSDQDILAALNAARPREQALSEKDLRLVRSTEFPGVVLVAYLSKEGTPLLGTAFVEGKMMPPGAAAREVLQKLGWAKADPPERVRLARLWVEKGMLAFAESMVEEATADFKVPSAPKFSPPELKVNSAGGVRIITWILEDPGLESLGHSYRQTMYLFGPDGALERTRMLDRFYAPRR